MNATALVARKLQAARQLRALALTRRCHAAIQPGAKILVLRKMASEHATVTAFVLGDLDGPPMLRDVIVDPRDRDEQHALFHKLGQALADHHRDALGRGEIPQLIVPAGSHAELIEFVARRMVRAASFTDYPHAEAVAELGNRLAYWGERRHVAGQQALLTATGLLREHFAFGQDESRNDHLGSLLCWMDGARDGESAQQFHARLAQLETNESASATPLPDFDKSTIEDFDRYTQARRDGDHAQARKCAARLRMAHLDALNDIFAQTQRALRHVRALEPMTMLRTFCELELEEALRHQDHVDAGGRVSFTDRDVRQAALRLTLRERAAEAWDRTLLYGDPTLTALARHDGTLYDAKVHEVCNEMHGRKVVRTITVRGEGQRFGMRAGDRALLLPLSHLDLRVLTASRASSGWEICLQVTGGGAGEGALPAVGEAVTVGPSLSDLRRDLSDTYGLFGAWHEAQRGEARERTAVPTAEPFPSDPIAALQERFG